MEHYITKKRRIVLGLGNFEQERSVRDQILPASAAEGRNGDGGRDGPEELGTYVGGSEAPT